jgi:hypothetical protein
LPERGGTRAARAEYPRFLTVIEEKDIEEADIVRSLESHSDLGPDGIGPPVNVERGARRE